MNTQWNTPPNGDFARYVERLSAESATARRTSQADGDHSLEGGPNHSDSSDAARRSDYAVSADTSESGQPGARAVIAAAKRRMLPPGSQGHREPDVAGSGVGFTLAKVLAVVWLVALLALFGIGAPVGVIFAVVALGLWSARGMRRWALPSGMTSWGQWLRETSGNIAQKRQNPSNRQDNQKQGQGK